jgi:hypothetical protein
METSSLPAPAEDERTFALLAHVLMIVSSFIGPMIIYLVKRDSRFVAFHALQALLWQVAYFAVSMVAGGFWFFTFFTMVQAGKSKGPPPMFFAGFFLFWFVMMAAWMVTLVLGVVYGIKASKGEWAAYPIVGRWARRLAGV